MKAATAPTRASPPRSAASSRVTSKSAVWTRTVITQGPGSSAGHRRKQRNFVARPHRRLKLCDIVVDGDAHGAPRRQLGSPNAAAGSEPHAELARRGDLGGQHDALARRAERIAQP